MNNVVFLFHESILLYGSRVGSILIFVDGEFVLLLVI